MILNGLKERSFLIVLNKEDLLVATLTHLITEHNIKGGLICGIGALKKVELGYYDLEHQTYKRKTFHEEDYELLSLNGTISLKENAPYVHVHAVLGKSDFSTFGGHLFEATVAVTAEITLIPLGKMPRRELNSAIGISLLCGF